MTLTFDYQATTTTNELRATDDRNRRLGWSQPTRILHLLLRADGKWVCGSTFLDFYMPTYSQRISKLVAKGEGIESTPCDGSCGHTHTGAVHAYRITR